MQPEYTDDEAVGLLDYWRIIWRRRWAAVAVCMVVVVSTTIFTFRARPIYVASAKILIEKESPRVVQFEDVVQLRAYDLDYYETQFKVLQSETLAQKVINKFDLKNSPEFQQEQDIVAYYANPETWIRLIRDVLTPLLTPPRAEPPRMDAEQLAEQTEEEKLLKKFLKRLNVKPLTDTRIAVLSFEGYDPELVTNIANALAESYIEYNYEKKYRVSRQAVQWLTEHLSEVKGQLEESERKLQEYKAKHRLVSLEKQNIVEQKLAELNTELTKARTETIGRETLYKRLLDSLDEPNLIEALPPVIHNPLIQDLKNEYATLSAEYSELSKRYGPKHPKIIRVQAQMEEMRQKINEEVRKIAASIETEYRVAKAREEMVEKSLEEQKQVALDLGNKAIEYEVLKRQAESNKAMYDTLLGRLKEADLTSELETSNIEILDRARVPLEPAKPRKGRNMLLAVLMGMFLGVGTAFLLEHLDNRVKIPQDVKRHLGVQCLGFVSDYRHHSSDVKQMNDLVALEEGGSEFSESFRYLRSNLLQCAGNNQGCTTFLVSSVLPREGKTLIVSNMAIMLARLDKRVLLIDGDLRKPRVHRLFYLDRSPGLSDIISGGATPSQAICDANVAQLRVLTSGSKLSAPAEALASERAKKLMEILRKTFDFILIDSPPVLSVSDPLVLAKYVDGAILVVESGKSPVAAVQAGLERFTEIDARIYGVVLNRVNIHEDGYYYYYYYRDYYYKKRERQREGV